MFLVSVLFVCVADHMFQVSRNEPMETTQTKRKKRDADALPLKPLTVPTPQAFRFLGIGRTKFDQLVDSEVFTVIADPVFGRGHGRRMYFHVDELEIFAISRDSEKVRKFRKEKGRMR